MEVPVFSYGMQEESETAMRTNRNRSTPFLERDLSHGSNTTIATSSLSRYARNDVRAQ